MCKQMNNSKYNYPYKIEISETILLCARNMSSGSIKNVIYNVCLTTIY